MIEVGIDGVVREEPGRQGAASSANGMHAEHVERIIVAKERLEVGGGQERNRSGDHTDDHAAVRSDEAASRGDDNQTGNRAGAEANDRRFALEEVFHSGPDEGGDCCRECRCGEGVGGNNVSSAGATGIEAVPTDPEQGGTDEGQHRAVRSEVSLTPAGALAEDQGENQARVTGRHMHHGTTGEVDRFDGGLGIPDTVEDTVNTPDAVSEREVNDEHPGTDEEQQGGELHAFSNTTDDQGRRDDREGQLEAGEDILSNPVTIALPLGVELTPLNMANCKSPSGE